MGFRILVFFIFLGCLQSCSSGTGRKASPVGKADSYHSSDATGFLLVNTGKYRKITVRDPWQNSTNNWFDYYLVDREVQVPDEISGKPLFRTPLKRVICLSTTHIGYLDALGELSAICGLSGSAYLSNPLVRKGVEENRIRDVGYDRGLNYEMIVQLKPDAVFAFGVGSEITAQINRLNDLGIPVVMVGEYLEQTPLAKSAWIKFFGAFFDREALADSLYNNIRSGYDAVKKKVAVAKMRPRVLTGLPFKDTWWIPGGHSNLAVLIGDAGGHFLWSENTSGEAFPVSLEEVFLRAATADFWINCGSVSRMEELLAFDARFTRLPVVQKRQVYNNNLRTSAGGGNDYWESGVVHPDLILRDLAGIFHPELIEKEEFVYYKKIK